MRTVFVFLGLFVLLVLPITASKSEETSSADEVEMTYLVKPKPVKRVPPRYPERAANKGLEGWVLVSLTVGLDGKPSNMEVVDGSGRPGEYKYFARAVLRAISGWRFEPARLNGESIEYHDFQQLVTFELDYGGKPGATRSFIRDYKTAGEFLDANEMTSFRQALDALFDRDNLNNYESARAHILNAQYYIMISEEGTALREINRALRGKDYLEDEIYQSALKQQVLLCARQSDLHCAIKGYETLTVLADDENIPPQVKQVATQLKGIEASSRPIAINGEISAGCNCSDENEVPFWRHQPLRRKFGFEQVEGQLDKLKLVCNYTYVTSEIDIDLTWQIPESYGDCSVHVYGELGTTFRLVEYAN